MGSLYVFVVDKLGVPFNLVSLTVGRTYGTMAMNLVAEI